MKNSKGITLIALVITIVVLLILAGVTINLTLGENGLFNFTQNAASEYSEKGAEEKLNIALADLQTKKVSDPSYNKDSYVTNYLENQEFVVDDEIVTVGDYQFEINRDLLKIEQNLGKASAETLLKPRLKVILSDENRIITANVTLKNSGGVSLSYVINKKGDSTVVEEENNVTDLTYTFEKLPAGTYIVSVTAANEYGQTVKQQEITIYDKPIKAAQIKSNPTIYYGKVVNYGSVPGATDAIKSTEWKICYADDTNIYLITSNKISKDYIPSADGILTDDTGVYLRPEKAKAFIAYLLDTSLWTDFVVGKAKEATGSPTLEQYNSSISSVMNVGYYWIATVGDVVSGTLKGCYFSGGVKRDGSTDYPKGSRPVVCLSDEAGLVEDENGKYNII